MLNANLHCNESKCQESGPVFSYRYEFTPRALCQRITPTKTTRGNCTSPSSSLQLHGPVEKVKTGVQVGDFQHPFTVLLPNTVFLSGEMWATLWEVVVLASIRGQLQC